MAKKRKRTVDDLYDQQRRNDPGPETRDLSAEEATAFEAARGAVLTLRKTFEVWTVIGKAVVIARIRADRIGGGKTFRRILEQQGLGSIPDATATRLQDIMARLPEVEAWRTTLNERQQIMWASPTAIIKHAKDPVTKLPLFPKKRGGSAVAQRRPSKNNVQFAIDLIADYCRDLAPDERAAILGQVGAIATQTPSLPPTFDEALGALLDCLDREPDGGIERGREVIERLTRALDLKRQFTEIANTPKPKKARKKKAKAAEAESTEAQP